MLNDFEEFRGCLGMDLREEGLAAVLETVAEEANRIDELIVLLISDGKQCLGKNWEQRGGNVGAQLGSHVL